MIRHSNINLRATDTSSRGNSLFFVKKIIQFTVDKRTSISINNDIANLHIVENYINSKHSNNDDFNKNNDYKI